MRGGCRPAPNRFPICTVTNAGNSYRRVPLAPHFLRLVALGAALAGVSCTSTTEAPVAPTPTPSAVAATSRRDDSRPVSVRGIGRVDRQRDAYVLLSGGGTPLTNNYSQYLQARAIAAFFERECPPERSWIFFGAGNREGAPAVLSDAHREQKHQGLLIDEWLPGALPRNRPATRESFLRALREEILPLVREGGTLYLFIGDHGELAGARDEQESAITLWQLKQNRRRTSSWFTDEKEILGVAELRSVLAAGLGEGRVVFAMTQCHGGGFHDLGLAREMIPPRAWFVGAPPAWAVGQSPGVRLRIAGFTATDEASPAAGCDADPDPERWAGYERFLPESLLGLDLMSGQARGRGAGSFAAAHEAATLVDRTIDKPRSTSEHYLEAWAQLIETRLTSELRLAPSVRSAVEAFHRAVERGHVEANDAALRERQAQFEGFIQRMIEQSPPSRSVLLTGTRQQLDATIKGRGERGGGGGRGPRRASMTDLRKTWADTLRPAWKTAVLGGHVKELNGAALAFEKRLLKLEDDGRNLLLTRGGGTSSALLNEIYWASGYAEPASLNRAKAEAIARWGAERRSRIVAWAKTSARADVRAAAEKIGPSPTLADEPPRALSPRTAAERVLFYRRVLAAWEFLVALRAETALSELRTLIELERLPVRPAS